MARSKAECAKAIVDALRPDFESTVYAIITERFSPEGQEDKIRAAVKDIVDKGNPDFKSDFPVKMDPMQARALLSRGLTADELVRHGFLNTQFADEYMKASPQENSIAGSRLDFKGVLKALAEYKESTITKGDKQ